MKTKILDKLKAIRDLKAVSVTDKTLEAYADLIATSVTEETQIDTEVGKYENLMVVSNGNIGFTAAEQIKLKKAEWEKDHKVPETIPPTPPTPPEPTPTQMTPESIAKLIADGITAGLAPLQKEKQNEQIITSARAAISEKFGIGESEKATSDYIFNNLSKGELTDVDALVNSYEAEYNSFRTAQGLGAVPPKVNKIEAANTETDKWAEGVKKQREEAAKKEEAAFKRVHNQN